MAKFELVNVVYNQNGVQDTANITYNFDLEGEIDNYYIECYSIFNKYDKTRSSALIEGTNNNITINIADSSESITETLNTAVVVNENNTIYISSVPLNPKNVEILDIYCNTGELIIKYLWAVDDNILGVNITATNSSGGFIVNELPKPSTGNIGKYTMNVNNIIVEEEGYTILRIILQSGDYTQNGPSKAYFTGASKIGSGSESSNSGIVEFKSLKFVEATPEYVSFDYNINFLKGLFPDDHGYRIEGYRYSNNGTNESPLISGIGLGSGISSNLQNGDNIFRVSFFKEPNFNNGDITEIISRPRFTIIGNPGYNDFFNTNHIVNSTFANISIPIIFGKGSVEIKPPDYDIELIGPELGYEENFTVKFEVVNNTSAFDVFSVKLLDLMNYTNSKGETRSGIISGIKYNKNSTEFTLGFSNPNLTQMINKSNL